MRPVLRRAAGLAALTLAACGNAPAPSGPDLLLITIDTLRADYLTVYGFPLDTSPNIQRLALESVVFDRADETTSVPEPVASPGI